MATKTGAKRPRDHSAGRRERLVAIDDELLAAAKEELGTATITATVNEALALVVRRAALREELEFLAAGGMAEMADEKSREQAWRRSG